MAFFPAGFRDEDLNALVNNGLKDFVIDLNANHNKNITVKAMCAKYLTRDHIGAFIMYNNVTNAPTGMPTYGVALISRDSNFNANYHILAWNTQTAPAMYQESIT